MAKKAKAGVQVEVPVTVLPRNKEQKIEKPKDVLDVFWPLTVQTFEGDGYHSPMVFVFTDEQVQMIDAAKLMVPSMKDVLSDLLHQIGKDPKVEAMMVVTETWMVTSKDEQSYVRAQILAMTTGLSDHPNREESLMAHVEVRGVGGTARHARIIRLEGAEKPVLGEPVDLDVSGSEGRMVGFFK